MIDFFTLSCWSKGSLPQASPMHGKFLDPIHTERERCSYRCCLENGYGTDLQTASLVAILPASLGVNGTSIN